MNKKLNKKILVLVIIAILVGIPLAVYAYNAYVVNSNVKVGQGKYIQLSGASFKNATGFQVSCSISGTTVTCPQLLINQGTDGALNVSLANSGNSPANITLVSSCSGCLGISWTTPTIFLNSSSKFEVYGWVLAIFFVSDNATLGATFAPQTTVEVIPVG